LSNLGSWGTFLIFATYNLQNNEVTTLFF